MFSAYGCVKATKVISDRAGVSKGYGFVTFETEEEAKRLVEIVSSLLFSLTLCVIFGAIMLL
jgi:RNA recognition motif-containing protein